MVIISKCVKNTFEYLILQLKIDFYDLKINIKLNKLNYAILNLLYRLI